MLVTLANSLIIISSESNAVCRAQQDQACKAQLPCTLLLLLLTPTTPRARPLPPLTRRWTGVRPTQGEGPGISTPLPLATLTQEWSTWDPRPWMLTLQCRPPWTTALLTCTVSMAVVWAGVFGFVLFFGYLTSQQHASVSQGWICSDRFMCCHTKIEDAGQTFHLTQSQYTDTGPTSPSTDPITPGAWQGSHWSANF